MYIVLEGNHGSGKSVQAKKLPRLCKKKWVNIDKSHCNNSNRLFSAITA